MIITKQAYVSADRVKQAAEAFGDFNPIHLDIVAVENTPFNRPIAHGMLLGGIIGSHLVEIFGEGTVWLEQTLKFSSPVYVDSHIEVTYFGIVQTGRKVEFSVTVMSEGRTCVTGIGTGLVKKND